MFVESPVRYVTKSWSVFLLIKKKRIPLSQVYCVWQVVKTLKIISNNPVFIGFVLQYGTSLYCIWALADYSDWSCPCSSSVYLLVQYNKFYSPLHSVNHQDLIILLINSLVWAVGNVVKQITINIYMKKEFFSKNSSKFFPLFPVEFILPAITPLWENLTSPKLQDGSNMTGTDFFKP